MVAAMDHSEVVAPALADKDNETREQRVTRAEEWISSRVPDVLFLPDHMLCQPVPEVRIDASRIGIVGHSFGG
jgi:predicted dienelactone hydrolase